VIPVVDARRMRAADAATIRGGVPSATLMENAARALATGIAREFAAWRRIVVVCGPGNNGGDGLAAARLLDGMRFSVRVFTLGDPDAYRGDAASNAALARKAGLPLEPLTGRKGFATLAGALREADGVVDALFGTGLDRPLSGSAARAVGAINAAGRPVVAADVPSGLSSDTGRIPGKAVRAAATVAFGAPKVCHVLPPARDLCGRLVIADIGISRAHLSPRGQRLFLATAESIRELLPPRDRAAHKRSVGSVAVIAGSRGKTGAAILAARGALRAGAGLVTIFCAESLQSAIVTALPEAMTIGLPEEEGALAAAAGPEAIRRLGDFDAAVLGPGLGRSPGAVAAIRAVVRRARLPLVLDADGLNAFAGKAAELRRRAGPTVATPHPGEAGRLLGRSTRDVQSDRLAAARALARSAGCCVLLKGETSLTATPDGRVVVNPTGSPVLATAGTGDVLAGVVAAFLAGGLRTEDATAGAAWIHGAAGDRLERTLGDAGALASEVADLLPRVRRALGRGTRDTGDGTRQT